MAAGRIRRGTNREEPNLRAGLVYVGLTALPSG
jgi:hypothetical protein